MANWWQGLRRFQSTHPCGVRLFQSTYHFPLLKFQSTHPCGVRQETEAKKANAKVSIHAPVWGATNLRFLTANPRTVSIHAPVWGATLKTQQDHLGIGFQSTHPCGVRPYTYLAIRKSAVSIHAPVWGATGRTNRLNETCSFNPRTRVGCDTLNFITYMRFLFQSTHPCGVRHCQH